MQPQQTETDKGVSVVGDVFKSIAHLLETIRDEQRLQREIALCSLDNGDEHGSGATDRLDVQALRQAEQQAQIDRLERGQNAIATRIGTMDLQVSEILRCVTPWWMRLASLFKMWGDRQK